MSNSKKFIGKPIDCETIFISSITQQIRRNKSNHFASIWWIYIFPQGQNRTQSSSQIFRLSRDLEKIKTEDIKRYPQYPCTSRFCLPFANVDKHFSSSRKLRDIKKISIIAEASQKLRRQMLFPRNGNQLIMTWRGCSTAVLHNTMFFRRNGISSSFSHTHKSLVFRKAAKCLGIN